MACGQPCHRPDRSFCKLYCNTPSTKAMLAHHVARCRACREPPYVVSWRAAALYRSAVPSYCEPKSPPRPRYKSLYRDSALNHTHCAPCRACAQPYRGRAVAISWPSSCRIVACYAVSWRAPARPCSLPPSLACHDTMHCIVTQHQNG